MIVPAGASAAGAAGARRISGACRQGVFGRAQAGSPDRGRTAASAPEAPAMTRQAARPIQAA